MAGNVMSWKEAIKKGYEPGLYPFSSQHVPIGEYTALLDFKIWAKKIMAISCYFTQVETGIKFQLTVYCSEHGNYRICDIDVDFTYCPTGQSYHLEVIATEKKKIVFKRAVLL